MSSNKSLSRPSNFIPTSGAVPVKNEQGKISMQKVKVHRYVAGKRPEYAASDGSEEGSDDEDQDIRIVSEPTRHSVREFVGKRETRESSEDEDKNYSNQASSSTKVKDEPVDIAELEKDPRYRRIQQRRHRADDSSDAEDDRRHRRIEDPEILFDSGTGTAEEENVEEERKARLPKPPPPEDEDDEEDDAEIAHRRALIKQRTMQKSKKEETEVVAGDQEGDEEESDDEESEYEEYTDSEDDTGPRLKPVFVRKRDRITLQDTEKEEQRIRDMQLEQKKRADERKRESVKILEQIVRQEIDVEREKKDDRLDLDAVNTDDENEELAYEEWKLRELKRIKRDRDERESYEKEKAEIEKVHNMTEEERKAWMRANPRVVTNKQEHGKMKFLQKYFHRGAFFLDEDAELFKRNFQEATLEDNFDKTVLPKVMQVKNFGQAGRTKWTHLTAEDTTESHGAWGVENPLVQKYFNKHAGGTREVERPSAKKRKN